MPQDCCIGQTHPSICSLWWKSACGFIRRPPGRLECQSRVPGVSSALRTKKRGTKGLEAKAAGLVTAWGTSAADRPVQKAKWRESPNPEYRAGVLVKNCQLRAQGLKGVFLKLCLGVPGFPGDHRAVAKIRSLSLCHKHRMISKTRFLGDIINEHFNCYLAKSQSSLNLFIS
jgi:hypothetical protein